MEILKNPFLEPMTVDHSDIRDKAPSMAATPQPHDKAFPK
jgi:hypothetical protein